MFILTIGFASAGETNLTDIGTDSSDDILAQDISVEGDSFEDIQNAINTSSSKDTIFLNSRTYTGNGTQITIDKSITIDGASRNSNSKSIIDANDSSRIFVVKGNVNLTLKNIIFQNAKVNGRGAVLVHDAGELSISNCDFQNINNTVTAGLDGGVISRGANCISTLEGITISNVTITTSQYMDGIFMFSGARSKVMMSDISSYDNIFICTRVKNNSCDGGLLGVGTNSEVTARGIRYFNNRFTQSNHVYGTAFFVSANSKLSLTDSSFNQGVINATVYDLVGGIVHAGKSCELLIDNFTQSGYDMSTARNLLGGGIFCDENSNMTLKGLVFEKNKIFVKGLTNGGFVRVGIGAKSNMTDVKCFDNKFASIGNFFGGLVYGYVNSEIISVNFNCSNNRFNMSNNLVGSLIYCNNYSMITIDGFIISDTFINAGLHRGIIYTTSNSQYNVSNLRLLNSRYIYEVNESVDPYDTIKNNYCFLVFGGEGEIRNSLFRDNYCDASLGVALQIAPNSHKNGTCIVDSCVFVNNTCGAASKDSNRTFFKDHGGAVCINGDYKGSVIIRKCNFTGNVNSQGGAITPHNNCILENCRFINNTATKFYGGAISTEDGIDINNANITIRGCYFEKNTAPIGGAIQAKGDYVKIFNCTFKDNSAVQGGAVFLQGNNLTLINCTFEDNNASDDVESQVVIGQDYLPQVQEWSAYGGAVYIHGFNSYLENNRFLYNSAVKPKNATLADKGGAIYIYGDNATVFDCYFDDNFAHSGNGSAIYVMGVNTTIELSKFYNHYSGRGTVFIRGSHASVLDSIFEKNTASLGGAGVYSIGNHSLVDGCTFENNNATVHGGAIHTHGDYIRVLNSRFTSNNAHPRDDDHEFGLGGAIYTMGDFNDIAYCEFDFNTARNGSAIYNRGDNLTVEDCSFHYNQAYSYLLAIKVAPVKSNYTKDNRIVINVTHIGGDNIINAIYNDGSHENIFFYNVTYEHSSTGSGKRNSGLKRINPVASAELSRNGELIYQDSREDLQIVDVIITRERDDELLMAGPISGDVIKQSTGRTGLYGNLSMTLTGDLKPGVYNVYASHPDDKLYKGIENSTRFEISPQVDLSIKKSSDRDSYFVGGTATFTITLESLGTDAHDVNVTEIMPQGFELISYSASKGTYSGNLWSIPLMAEKTKATLTLKVRVTQAGTFTNVVNATSRENDTNPSNNVANKTVKVKTYVDLKVTKTSDVKSVKVGDRIVWTITLTNEGLINATGVKVKDRLPSGLKYLSHTSDKGDYDQSTGIWDVGEVAVNDTFTLTIETEALKEGKITNSISVTSNEDDFNSSDNKAECTVDVTSDEDGEPGDDNADDPQDTPDDSGNSRTVSKTSLSAKQDMHATGNPIAVLALALFAIFITTRRKL